MKSYRKPLLQLTAAKCAPNKLLKTEVYLVFHRESCERLLYHRSLCGLESVITTPSPSTQTQRKTYLLHCKKSEYDFKQMC